MGMNDSRNWSSSFGWFLLKSVTGRKVVILHSVECTVLDNHDVILKCYNFCHTFDNQPNVFTYVKLFSNYLAFFLKFVK